MSETLNAGTRKLLIYPGYPIFYGLNLEKNPTLHFHNKTKIINDHYYETELVLLGRKWLNETNSGLIIFFI